MKTTDFAQPRASIAAHIFRVGTVLLVLTLFASIFAPEVHGRGASARSLAMGGAFTGLATGVNAAKFNPANLGLDGYRRTGLEIVSLSADVNNNSFTLGDYNRFTGAFLTDADKSYILGRIPAEGLKFKADACANALSLSVGSLNFMVDAIAAADINLSKDILELVLNGNAFGDTVRLTGSYADGISYGKASVSYGRSLYSYGSRQLAVGLSAGYLYGIGVQQVTQLEGFASTEPDGFSGQGRMISRNASGGSGYAVDLGVALRLNGKYTVGARLENLVGSISWSKNTKEQGYLFSFDTMTVDNATEDYVTAEDYDRSIGSFSTTLPRTLTVGFASTTGPLLWALDWEQGLNNKFGISTKPRVSGGLEWRVLSFLPLRAGYSVGGERPHGFSFGSGLTFGGFYLDFASVTGSSFSPQSSKGAHLAISTGIEF